MSKKDLQFNLDLIRSAKKLACDEAKFEEQAQKDNSAAKIYTIAIYEYQNVNSFNWNELKIKSGDTVRFQNFSKLPVWPASDDHPTHTKYPGTDNSQCGTGAVMFDACGPVKFFKTFEFTFNEKGTWGFHDHLNPEVKGTIIVE